MAALHTELESHEISLQVISFGYKYGVPLEADLVFAVRFMENPFYIDELRPLSGTDERVRRFVLDHAATREFLTHLEPLLRFSNYYRFEAVE